MDAIEGIFRSYAENKMREFLRTLNINPIEMTVEISKFVDNMLDKLVELFRDELDYRVNEINCETLSDIVDSIDQMHDNLITSYETITRLETELENERTFR